MTPNGKTLAQVLAIDRIYTAFVSTYDEGFSFAGESHDMWELDIFRAGNAGVTSGSEIYDCRKDDLVIHPAGVFHNVWEKQAGKVRILTVSFTGKGVEQFVPVGKFSMSAGEKQFADLLEAELTADGEGKPYRLLSEDGQVLRNLLELLFLSLYRRKNESKSPTRDRQAATFSQISNYLAEHVDECLTVGKICHACAIGQTALKELFRTYTGIGVMKYYNRLRIRRSIELISMGKSMAEIADEMGFSSQNYFSAFFKRETGVSPSRYFVK